MGIPHFTLSKRAKKILLIVILLLVSCFLLTTILVWSNKEKIKSLFVSELNKCLVAEVKVRDIDVEFLSSFPMVSVVFGDVVINDVLDSLGKDRFVAVKELGIRFNVRDILSGTYSVKKILVEDGAVNLRINSKGECNYIFWKESEEKSKDSKFAFALNSVEFKNVALSFRNDISRLYVKTSVEQVEAKGNFSDSLQELALEGDLLIDAFIFDKLKLAYPQKLRLNIGALNNREKSLLSLSKAKISLSDMSFDLKGAYIYGEKDFIDVALIAKGIDLKEVFSLIGKDSKDLLKGFESEGLVNFQMSLKGELSKEILPEVNADFDIVNASLRNRNVLCERINLKGSYSNGEKRCSRTSVLRLDNFSFNLNKGFFEGSAVLSDFSNFNISAKVKADLNLEDVKPFLKQDSLVVLKGNVKADVALKAKGMKSFKAEGSVKFRDLAFKDLRLKEVELDKANGELVFDDKGINILSLNAMFNSSPLSASGLVNDKGVRLNASLKSYAIDDMVLEDIKGRFMYSSNVVSSDDLNFKIFDGKFSSKDCRFVFGDKENVLKGECVLNNVDLEKAFKAMDNFSQSVITDKNLSGALSANAVFSLHFDKDFKFLDKISSFNIDYSINKGRIRNLELMNKLSLFVEEDALKDVRFENIKSSLQLEGACINFAPISIRSNIVDFECFGKHTLDNKIDYQFAINLSELSSRKRREKHKLENEGGDIRMKLFVRIEGMLDNPKFSFNLQSDMKKVKEKVSQDRKDIVKSIDKEFKLNIEESKKDKKNWEKQEKGEYIIEWEEEKEENKKEKEFENSEFIIEWED